MFACVRVCVFACVRVWCKSYKKTACTSGYTLCGGRCVSTRTDKLNCAYSLCVYVSVCFSVCVLYLFVISVFVLVCSYHVKYVELIELQADHAAMSAKANSSVIQAAAVPLSLFHFFPLLNRSIVLSSCSRHCCRFCCCRVVVVIVVVVFVFVGCTTGWSPCGTNCVVLASDPQNCGSCGTVCSNGCSNGVCSNSLSNSIFRRFSVFLCCFPVFFCCFAVFCCFVDL